MCCTFNALAAEELYYQSKFAQSVSQLQKKDIRDSFETPVHSPESFETSGEPYPDIGMQINCLDIFLFLSCPGQSQGLSLIIDAHSDAVSPGTVHNDYEGFITIVNSRSMFPSVEKVKLCIDECCQAFPYVPY